MDDERMCVAASLPLGRAAVVAVAAAAVLYGGDGCRRTWRRAIGLLLYNRFKMAMKQTAVSNAESMVESTVDKLDAELLNVRQIMNAVNYNIIQENDISSDDFNRQFSLLYEINTDKVQSMALYDSNGAQLVAEPVSERKKGVKASEQDWYTNAEEEIENVHFSLPHIQNLFAAL